MRKPVFTENDIERIISFVSKSETKSQVKEFFEENDYKHSYVFFRLFSLRDEGLLGKIPNQFFKGSECIMLYYFFGEEGEKYYPAKQRQQARFYRGNNLRIVDEPISFSDDFKLYEIRHFIYNGDDRIGLAYTEYYQSMKDWAFQVGNNLEKKWLYDIKIPKKGIKDINFTGAYVKKEDSERLKGSIPIEKRIINKKYEPELNEFFISFGYVDPDGRVIKQGGSQWFDTFNEFATFLGGDLSGGGYSGYDFRKIKLEKYDITDAIIDDPNKCNKKEIPSTAIIEELKANSALLISKSKNLPVPVHEEEYGTYCLYYISDLHLDHKIIERCKTDSDIDRYITKKVQQISDSIYSSKNFYLYSPVIIAGDVSFSFELNRLFFTKLRDYVHKDIIVVLGNHELWFNNYRSQIEKYRELFSSLGIVLLDNGFYTINKYFGYNTNNKHYYTEEYLESASLDELRNLVKDSHIAFFGGIGFAGKNEEFNALNGIYRDALSRDQEIQESKRFEDLYSKLLHAFGDRKNVAIVTHMPPKDWTKCDLNENWIYIYGHNHRSRYQNDDTGVILADNQIGYKERKFNLCRYVFDGTYDIFADYHDGIYEITAEEYRDFCYGKGISMQYTVQKPIIMIKKHNVYMFMRRSTQGYSIMNGGMPTKVKHNPTYYYDHMDEQIDMILTPLRKFTIYQKQYSAFIKTIGGSGCVHGCIVDIDFFNHIYINPIDGSAVPYHAEDIINKTIYKDIKTLLGERCPALFDKYIDQEKNLPAKQENELIGKIPYFGTDIYKLSKKLRAMQYLEREGVLRCWYERNSNPYRIVEENEKYLTGD